MFLLALAMLADPDLLALQAADARVADVAWRLQTANVALCRDVRPLPGFSIHALAQYVRGERAAAIATFGLDASPAVLAVARSSGAERAGLRPNDRLIAIEGVAVAPAPPARGYDAVERVEDAIDAGLADGILHLEVSRGDQRLRIGVPGDHGCASRVQFVPGPALNASADGAYVQITGRMVEFADTDHALAVIMAHELSHNILGHRVRLDAQRTSRGLFAGIGRNGARLRTTELEADRLSVALVANAGYRLDAIVPFWTALRARADYGFLASGTHPGWTERMAALARAVAEQTASQAARTR